MKSSELTEGLESVAKTLETLLDKDVFPWLNLNTIPSEAEKASAASVLSDRLCSSLADPLIRNEQERRQLDTICKILNQHGYNQVTSSSIASIKDFPRHCYAIHYNVQMNLGADGKS